MAPTFSKPAPKAAKKTSPSAKVPTKIATGMDLSPIRRKLQGTRINDPLGKYEYLVEFQVHRMPDNIAALSATCHHKATPERKTGAYTREFEKCLVQDLNGLTTEGEYNFGISEKLQISDILDQRGPDGEPLHRALNPKPGDKFYRKIFIYLIESEKEWETDDYDSWAKKIIKFLNDEGFKLGFWKYKTLCKYTGCCKQMFVNDILLDKDTAHLLKLRYVYDEYTPETVMESGTMSQYFREPMKMKQYFLDICNADDE